MCMTRVIGALLIAMLLVFTACAPAPTPAPSPAAPSAPAPKPTPAPLPPPPPIPEPAPAPTPTEQSKLDLVETAPPSHQLDVTPVYAGHDVCMLGSLAMLLKYDDPSLEFCDLVGNIGMGSIGKYRPDKATGVEFKFDAPDGRWSGMVFAPQNSGYSLIVGIANGGRIDEQINAPPDAPPSVIEQKPRVKREAKRIEYFDNVDDAFDFLKRVVASGYPVEVHLNTIKVMHDFAKATSHWADNAAMWTRGGLTTVSHFMVVTGYDTTHVYLNDPTDPGKPINLPATVGNFKAAWNVPEEMWPNNTGPYWILFVKKSGERKSIDDILAWNKQRAIGAPSQIRLFGENTLGEFTTGWAQKEIYVTSEMRLEYARFLKKNGKTEAATIYEQSSKLWEGLLESSTVSEDIKRIADLEEQARRLY